MCSMQELPNLKARILEKVKLAAQDGDVTSAARWVKAAEQCEKFIQESIALNNRVKTFTEALWQEQGNNVLTEQTVTPAPKMKKPKLEGKEARDKWVKMLSSKGILLSGHGKRYYTQGGQSVGIAFANELDRPNLLDKWFLGLKDEPTDIAVLLCQDLEKNLHDFILPVAKIESTWKSLSRSGGIGGQVKFNVRRKQGEFLLLDANGEPLNITKYLSKYQTLNRSRA